jgi:exoribonuclease-2
LSHLGVLAAALRRTRLSLGAVDVERAEMSVKVRESGEVEVRVLHRPDSAREMVAELMILCNSLLAAFCSANQVPAMYRCQQAPDPDGVAAAMETPEGPLRRFLLMRLIRPVEMDTVPAPHSALGAQAYIQATSPLRRYPDLVMQRQISYFLSEGKPLYSTEGIASVAQRSALQMRELAQLEEQRKRYWFMKYLRQSHLEQPDRSLLPAVVLENPPNRHALLELADYPFRVRAEVPRKIDAGERVTLKLHSVDLWTRAASLVYQERGT